MQHDDHNDRIHEYNMRDNCAKRDKRDNPTKPTKPTTPANHNYSEKKNEKKDGDTCNHALDLIFFDEDEDALEPDTAATSAKSTFILIRSFILLMISSIICFFAVYEIMMDHSSRTTTTAANNAKKTNVSVTSDMILSSEKTVAVEKYAVDYFNATTPHLSCYAYSTLNSDLQKLYVEIYETITNFGEITTLSTLSEDSISTAYAAVLADHGELFWVKGYSIRSYMQGKKIIQLDFVPMYTMDKSAALEYKESVDAAVADILEDAPVDGNAYDKLKFVYDYLATNVTYDVEAAENQNILSVFLYQETVCQGYAASLQYLLRELGIHSTIITGTFDELPHAWNLVRLDGDYYYVDATSARMYLENSGEYIVDYSYFAVTTDDISSRYVADDSFTLPNCDAKKYNYFIEEGRFFSEFDTSAIGNVYKDALANGEMDLSIRLASSDLLKQVRNYFINEGHIYEYCGTGYDIYYIENKKTNILTIRFQ